tara:strand:+ start:4249 stop:6336 length:2088 start_codon:yes stop_codon:yes gene_type:complete
LKKTLFEIRNTEITYLKGVGPKRAVALKKNGIFTFGDIIKHYPRKYLDRTNVKKIKDLKVAEQAVVIGKVVTFRFKKTFKRNLFELIIDDGTGQISCLWFNGVSWICDKFTEGDSIAIFGKVEYRNGYSIIHPEFDKIDGSSDLLNTGKIIPVYSSTSELKSVGLDSKGFRKIILNALQKVNSELTEFLTPEIISQENLISHIEAVKEIHDPKNKNLLDKAIHRIKFEEHFFFQILMAMRKKKNTESNGRQFLKRGQILKKVYHSLPFKLTRSQIEVLKEIRQDLSSSNVMNRLLQGDVGCGKTVVAALSSAIVVDNNAQVAILAPTEILAEQHFKSFKNYFKDTNVSVDLLIGKMNLKKKTELIEKISDTRTNIVVGTHALLQENVVFKDLGLIIIDEQHRFGVSHRKKIVDKGINADILSMTATPIPRTLAITIHGDMDISIINELPKNRPDVLTKVISQSEINETYEFMKREMSKNNQCFIVYPIIEESEKLDLRAASTAYTHLKNNIFEHFNVGYIDGRMKKEDRDTEMIKFSNKIIKCLISTTVIEVGIDIPSATVMVIENADRFGLSQLHQLRGRIGRGNKSSFCFLVKSKDDTTKRLKILEKTRDGFLIADEDLKIRGPGEFFGTRQHGYLKTGLADFYNDGAIIRTSRFQAFKIIKNDPNFKEMKNKFIFDKLHQDYSEMLQLINIG